MTKKKPCVCEMLVFAAAVLVVVLVILALVLSTTVETYSSVRCAPGSYSNARNQCELCPPGSRSFNAGAKGCQACPPGHYQPNAGRRTCIKCPAGTRAFKAGAAGCQLCPPGHYQSKDAQRTCNKCPPGTRAYKAGATGCQRCPPGYAQSKSGQRTCAKCPRGTIPNRAQTGCRRSFFGRLFDLAPAAPPQFVSSSSSFDRQAVVSYINAKRANDYPSLPQLTWDDNLASHAQAKAELVAATYATSRYLNHDAGIGNPTYDFRLNGAYENLAEECDGSPTDAVSWALSKWYDFEHPNLAKRQALGTNAQGISGQSPCYVNGVDLVTLGHHKALTLGSDGSSREYKIGIGLAPCAADPVKWIVSSWTK